MNLEFPQTLSLEDAVRLSGPLAFELMLKPAGSLCNLDCSYCYYLDKNDLYGGREPVMDERMLETVIREYIAASDVPEVRFNWHGGEPLVLGLDFFRRAVALERKYAGGKTIANTLQTNGVLLDREWAAFLREENFLVGISIDGPQDLHDRYRKDRGGRPSFERVLRGLEWLHRYDVAFNTMTTVNRASEGRGREVYRFLKALGSRYMQFMPVVEFVQPFSGESLFRIVPPSWKGAEMAPWSVGACAFGQFLCDIFDEWVRRDVSQYFVGQFDAALASWCGVRPGICVFSETCGGCAVVEHNGDVYPCDHFVYPRYRLGNIAEQPLRTLMESDAAVRFGTDKRNGLPASCRRCQWLFACHGECPQHRYGSGFGAGAGLGAGAGRDELCEPGLNALCEGYRLFFSHVAPYMEHMRDLLSRRLSPAAVMRWSPKRLPPSRSRRLLQNNAEDRHRIEVGRD